MKRISQIMEEVGFRKDAPESVKKAFLDHLFQQAQGFQGDQRNLSPEQNSSSGTAQPQQLSFDFAQDSKAKIG